MKTNRFTCAALTATLILGMTACTNSSNEPDNWKVEDDPITTTLQASIAGADTRTTMDEDANTGAIECKWETGNKFKLIHSITLGTNTPGTVQNYTLTKGVGEKTGTFTTTDKAPTGDGIYFAFYPETTTLRNGSSKEFFFSPQMWTSNSSTFPTQSKDAPLAHLKPYHYLGATGTYTNGNLGVITFRPMGSILSLEIATSGGQSITPSSITFKANSYFRASNIIQVDKDGNMTDAKGWSTNKMPLNLSGYDNVTNFTANFMLPYQDLSTFTLTIEVTVGTDTYVSDSFNGINLVGGKRYTKSVTVTKQ